MPKTLVEKVASPRPDVAIFRISGTLGYHENTVLTKFFVECSKKGIAKLIMDLTNLTSLGGGCAKIISKAALDAQIVISIVGGPPTAQNFLEKGGKTPILYTDSVESALSDLTSAPAPAPGTAPDPGPLPEPEVAPPAPAAAAPAEPPLPMAAEASQEAPVAVMEEAASAAKAQPVAPEIQTQEVAAPDKAATPDRTTGDVDLQRKLVQYRALFSLNSDFNRFREKANLLDAFLLSTIAQVGVESAAFLEPEAGAFVNVAWKGFETADPSALQIPVADIDIDKWMSEDKIFHVDAAPITDGVRETVKKWGMMYLAPFVIYGEFRGIVLLGNPIRKALDDDAWDFLRMLIAQAAIAYENSCRFEAESERTLGVVHSLITMIEENTVSRGHTEHIVNYVAAVARAVHYPEEHMRNLMYGTVLRDIGMIKISDLIVRSPRELVTEEWEIIKRHPLEGESMLIKMKFSEHTRDIVRTHHERYNGEGYPEGLQGPQIPLGSRIVSVVESFVAMLNDRPTRPALSQEEALNTMRENWGDRYDPEIVAKFIEVVEEEIRTGEKPTYKGVEYLRV